MQATTNRSEGSSSIASAFASLSSAKVDLPPRFIDLKRSIIHSHEEAVLAGWTRLLQQRLTLDKLKKLESNVIPEVEFADIVGNKGRLPNDIESRLRECGTIIVRGLVSTDQALNWKQQVRDYVKLNPQTEGFPAGNIQVYELYWSKAQLEARSHANMLLVQTALNRVWRAKPQDPVDLDIPVTYCDRLRMRTPGDQSFNLGPHLDGGSLERWEDPEYRQCYSSILRGDWEKHDPFDATHRLKATVDMYKGPGGCSAFRSYQGWLSLSDCKPGSGTLRVMPDLTASTAYTLLRPFVKQDANGINWTIDVDSPTFHGADMGKGQELTETDHSLLNPHGFVSIPPVRPGDAVFWHCDVAHMVEAEHCGKSDSSVFYIPALPLCEINSKYVKDQRENFLRGIPPPDFPGGVGESEHTGRGKSEDIQLAEGRRAMGLGKFEVQLQKTMGQKNAIETANKILGFA
ncbi:hypothetical protein BGW36DRAFT_358130 [Talaromyces proteolyticus]|uniref:DUF1479 domain protein n=1 Tax=Talaromyces proteolyticus TaxID=1131652 RepID=A0AAD4KY13_9EURO|nr:uncharacterized protein BGW36DRAFT_358130 [Talaromyces proteolyticus]KAH8698601.1 hypothetical protein BGW36DRAFT_358130 [Talaromyces proteolyticus]